MSSDENRRNGAEFVMVCFDVSDNRRRRRIARELDNFGGRVQRSVFECELSRQERKQLAARLAKLINPAHDSVQWFTLRPLDVERIVSIGGRHVARVPMYVVV